jgi:hypothetical protein
MTGTLEATTRTKERWKSRDVWCGLAGAVSLALAVGAASTVAVPVNSDLGLVAVLPFPFWVGVLLLNVAFVVALRGDAAGPARRPVMIWLTVVLVLVLFGTAAFATDVPRGEIAFRHLGIADALSHTQGIDPDIDGYFNWPGFFALLATVLQATGLDPVALALWAPVLNMGLWLAALAVLTGYLTRDPRRRWLALWLFCLGNWHDQDYLSPQAFGFFLHLVVIALLLGPLAARAPQFHGFRRADLAAWWRGRSPAEPRPGYRVGALVITLLLIIVIGASHQLTPFMLLIGVTALTLSGRVWPSRLPLITIVVLSLWLAYPASIPFRAPTPGRRWAGGGDRGERPRPRARDRRARARGAGPGRSHPCALWGSPPSAPGATGAEGVSISGWYCSPSPHCCSSPPRCTAGRCSSASHCSRCPSSRCRRARSCFPRTAANFLRSAANPPRQQTPLLPAPWANGLPRALTCVLLSVLTVTGRFGNARYDVFTHDEIDAVAAMQRLAPPGSAIISAAHPTPWRSEAYLDHRSRTIDDLCRSDLSTARCGPLVYDYARHNAAGAVLLITRSSEASLVLQGVPGAGGFSELEKWLSAQNGVELMFSNVDARVYRVTP